MHCDQCGKENRPGSKFCRHCGHPFSEDSAKISKGKSLTEKMTWKSPVVLILIGLVLAGGLFYGGSKAYAYFQVESKISSAEKLQTSGDYKGSLDILNGLENKNITNGQKTRIDALKIDDQKFIGFKVSFENAITIANATSTKVTSEKLQEALKDLQSIESDYPEFKKVQEEMTKVQNALVITLQSEADVSKKAAADAAALAEKNRQAAAAAQAAKARAEEDAQRAQSDANAAASKAEAARTLEVQKSFVNQLTNGYNTFVNDAMPTYSKAISYLNAGSDYTALALFGQVKASDNSVYQVALSLLTNFSNMPKSYTDAAYALGQAALYEDKAADSAINSMSSSYDTSATTNYNSSQASYYIKQVASFLSY